MIPSLFKRVVAQVNAVGVAKDNAHGQVATNTDRVIQKASSGKCCCQYMAVPIAVTKIIATKYWATVSEKRASLGLCV